MINSILIFLSQWNQMPYKIKIFSICLCLSRLLFSLPLNINNVLINMVSCVIMIFFSLIITKVKNYIINALFAICSKLTYSILIDTICYCIFPQIRLSYSFLNYILSGLFFNANSVWINIITMLIILLVYNSMQVRRACYDKFYKFNTTKIFENLETLSKRKL